MHMEFWLFKGHDMLQGENDKAENDKSNYLNDDESNNLWESQIKLNLQFGTERDGPLKRGGVSRMTDDFSTSPSPRDSRGFVEKINEEAN